MVPGYCPGVEAKPAVVGLGVAPAGDGVTVGDGVAVGEGAEPVVVTGPVVAGT